jgi:hypothetical protein
MAGVVFSADEGMFSWARFYLESVELAGVGADEAVRQQLRAEAGPAGRQQ